MKFIVKENERLPQLNAVSVPNGVDEARVRQQLLQEFNIEIGAGLGALAGKIFRIGLMGYGSNMKNVLLCLGAMEKVLLDLKAPIERGAAESAAVQV